MHRDSDNNKKTYGQYKDKRLFRKATDYGIAESEFYRLIEKAFQPIRNDRADLEKPWT